MRQAFAVAFGLIASAMAPSAGLAAGYRYVTFSMLAGSPNQQYVTATGVNDRGEVVGYADSLGVSPYGFLYSNGSFAYAGPSLDASYYDEVSGISRSGAIVGSGAPYNGPEFGFVVRNGKTRVVTLPDGTALFARGINRFGQIVGAAQDSGIGGSVLLTGSHVLPIIVPGSTTTLAYGVNDAGEVAGTYTDKAGAHGFFYAYGFYSTLDAPGAVAGETFAMGLNNAGQVVGGYADAAGVTHGFVEQRGRFVTLDVPSAQRSTIANGINDHGVIVGNYVVVYSAKPSDQTVSGFIATPR